MVAAKDSVLKSLVALLGVFIIGYASIISVHFIFVSMINGVDKKIKNEQARYQIGEYIVQEINTIERQYYQMTMSFTQRELAPIQKKIAKEIEDIRHAIEVLEKGGTLKCYITLNLVGISETVEYIHYTPDTNSQYTFEVIDLLPKLQILQTKLDEMDEVIKLENEITKTLSLEHIDNKRFELRLFYKQIPAMFIRMKENASRLLYESKQQLNTLQEDIQKEKEYYRSLEIIVTIVVMLFVFLLGYVVIKQILAKSKELSQLTKKAEDAAKEAKNANETKSRFLANMSHEIRTPLNAIIGFSEILSNEKLDPEQKEKATIITNSAKALLGIINDVLDISKVESGKFEITAEKTDLGKTLSSIVELFAINAKQKDIRLVYNSDPDIPTFVDIDEIRIKQVLSNLLSNAIKFTDSNKKVTLSIKVLDKNEQQHQTTLRFSIKDEGIGISRENQKKIFEPFSQADNTITKRFGGTGLGLAISMKIIELMGSKIQLLSKENEGSTFYFDLPLKFYNEPKTKTLQNHSFFVCPYDQDEENIRVDLVHILERFGKVYSIEDDLSKLTKLDLVFCFGQKEYLPQYKKLQEQLPCPSVYVGNYKKIQSDKLITSIVSYYLDVPLTPSKVYNIVADACNICKLEPTQSVDKRTFQGKILVAEDNTNNQLLIKLLLQEYGIEPVIVDDGKQAVQAYEDGSFDLLFLDINMPVMDGLEALEHILEIEKDTKRFTPKIALTANSLKGDKEKFLSKGMDNYLSKPIDNEKLGDILAIYLRSYKSKPTPKAQKNIDYTLLAKQFGVSDDTAKMMIQSLKKSIQKDIKQLSDAIEQNNQERIIKTARSLKTDTMDLGLDYPCNILYDIESTQDSKKVKESFTKLKEYLEDILS